MEETRNENNHEKVNERKHGIVVEHVYKSFGKEHVLVDVNLEIPPGKIYGVVGNNGSGKTVLMRVYASGQGADPCRRQPCREGM